MIKEVPIRTSMVLWRDSTALKRAWHDVRDVEQFARNLESSEDFIVTIGYLICTTKNFYIFCGTVQYEEGKAVSFAGINAIPKGCVIRGPSPLRLPKKWKK